MYINEVIRLVRGYYPSEYSEEEMLLWCNEVSSMLSVEDRYSLHERILTVGRNGEILLPEGVDAENVFEIRVGGRRLKKQEYSPRGRRLVIPSRGASACVVYYEPYMPIRLVKYRGAVRVDGEKGCFTVHCADILPGDSVKLSFLNAAGAAETVLQGVMIMGRELTGDGIRYEACSPDGSFEAAGKRSVSDCMLTRDITDKTVCDAPFDGMYTDYILAKINMLQRDMEAYNQFMTAFNSRLAAYKRWLARRLPQGDGKLVNWW